MEIDGVRLMALLVQYQGVVEELTADVVALRAELGILPRAPQRCQLQGLLAGIERSIVADYWETTGHHLQQTAGLLGMNHMAVYRRLRQYGLHRGAA